MQVTTSVISSEMSRKGDQYWSFPSSKSFHGFDEGHTNKTERCIRGAARAWANIPNDVWIVESVYLVQFGCQVHLILHKYV